MSIDEVLSLALEEKPVAVECGGVRPHEPVPEEVRRVADLLERRYAVSILYASHQGCTRFSEFRQALGEIPPGTLAQRLVELEEAGVLRREVVADARRRGSSTC